MSKRLYCMDKFVCEQSCNISDFYCKYYNLEWPANENCGCPPNEHWGFNHDQRETVCFFKDEPQKHNDDVEFQVWKFGPKITLKHNRESNHCDTCVRIMHHIAAQMNINKGGVLDLYGLKIYYNNKGDMEMA